MSTGLGFGADFLEALFPALNAKPCLHLLLEAAGGKNREIPDLPLEFTHFLTAKTHLAPIDKE